MPKKDFTAINTSKADTGVTTGEVFTTIEKGKDRYKQQDTASPEEQFKRANQLKTQGRKGCKATRINMAITPDNYQFIKVMSQISGKSLTGFCNFVFSEYRREHPEAYEKAKAIIEEYGII